MKELVERGFVDLSYMLHCGVYVLLYKGEAVYVGKSNNPPARIGQHSRKIAFDQILFLRCKKEELDRVERDLIFELSPELNVDYLPVGITIKHNQLSLELIMARLANKNGNKPSKLSWGQVERRD